MPRARFLRPAVALAAVPAAALLVVSSAGAAPVATSAPVKAAVTTTTEAHPTPLHLENVHGTDVLNQPAGTSGAPQGSSNWAGYVATGSWNGAGFRYVQATFNVPSVNCTSSPSGNATYPDTFDDWVGLDGVGYNFTASSSVEQTGIYGQCVNGAPAYGAWWEAYPSAETPISFTVSPGDAITASVFWDSTRTVAEGQYDIVLADVTTGQDFSQYVACAAASCANSSAEVITEAPAVGSATLPLADYGIANYENAAVTDRSGQRASFLSSDWVNTAVEQLNSAGTAVVSAPGPLFGGQAFSTYWHAEGNTPPTS
ncbi:MAG TPA: G1 family glutamic endopeptidase [Streptosporangiaceae bacterium]